MIPPGLVVGSQSAVRGSKVNNLTSEMGRKLGREIRAVTYLECSALTGEGLQTLFSAAVRAALEPQKQKKWRKIRECSII